MDTRASVIRRPAPSAFAALGSALPFLPPLTVRRHLWYAPPCVLRRNAAQRCAATLRSEPAARAPWAIPCCAVRASAPWSPHGTRAAAVLACADPDPPHRRI